MTVAKRRSMSLLSRIADWWSTPGNNTVFPELQSNYIGWGEPFCFRCGWLAPVKDGVDDPWRAAKGWLERAHLLAHEFGGTGTPDNLVALCSLCHRIQPSRAGRDEVIAWIAEGQPKSCPHWWQCATDLLIGERSPGRGEVFNMWLRISEARLRKIGAAA